MKAMVIMKLMKKRQTAKDDKDDIEDDGSEDDGDDDDDAYGDDEYDERIKIDKMTHTRRQNTHKDRHVSGGKHASSS